VLDRFGALIQPEIDKIASSDEILQIVKIDFMTPPSQGELVSSTILAGTVMAVP